jgi:hypothetical protein
MSNIFQNQSNQIFFQKFYILNRQIRFDLKNEFHDVFKFTIDLKKKEEINEKSFALFLNIVRNLKNKLKIRDDQKLRAFTNEIIKNGINIIINLIIEDLSELKKIQKNQSEDLQNFISNIENVKKDNNKNKNLVDLHIEKIFNSSLVILFDFIQKIKNSLKLNLYLLENFDSHYVKSAIFLLKKQERINDSDLKSNINLYNSKLNFIFQNHQNISQKLNVFEQNNAFKFFINNLESQDLIFEYDKWNFESNKVIDFMIKSSQILKIIEFNKKDIVLLKFKKILNKYMKFSKNLDLLSKKIQLNENYLKKEMNIFIREWQGANETIKSALSLYQEIIDIEKEIFEADQNNIVIINNNKLMNLKDKFNEKILSFDYKSLKSNNKKIFEQNNDSPKSIIFMVDSFRIRFISKNQIKKYFS